MVRPRVLVLSGYGINCEQETAHAFNLPSVGGEATVVHLGDLLARPEQLDRFHILVLPGGFSFGDHIAAGAVLATKLRYRLEQPLSRFLRDGKLVIGICNGFQVLVRLGLLPASGGLWQQEATLAPNDSGRFEDRWVYLRIEPACPSPLVEGIERLYLPVRHGEGKFVPRDAAVLQAMQRQHLVAARYCAPDGGPASYPWNPNGSVDDIAAVCDPSGRVFGLMPHPEAYVHRTQHPRWTRECLPEEGMGVRLFRNAVTFARTHLL
ncbi:MAG: phosphoribosylformylglycinamidine synthase [Candidatus Tectimicrobiota bacterium]|nr:MAG: phosphoribosylformylglycinamidine synthase [Candidatus Tectomicrobia bacterium]